MQTTLPQTADVDVLVPTYRRPAALAVTLTALLAQSFAAFRVIVSDQTEDSDAWAAGEVQAAVRLLRLGGRPVELVKHLPRRGLAEHRQSLLARASAPLVLFLDDDVICEPDLLARLVRALREAGCGFVGSFVEAPAAVTSTDPVNIPDSHLTIEPWDGPVRPERLVPGGPGWERHRLHFAAHLRRVAARDGLDGRGDLLYRVAWVGGCVLYDRAKLCSCGGFSFWPLLPATHVGEDVAAQLAVMAVHGGAGLLPSGAWHQELPTTLAERDIDAPYVLGSAGWTALPVIR